MSFDIDREALVLAIRRVAKAQLPRPPLEIPDLQMDKIESNLR